jgi:hypothetical protein
LNTYLKEIRKMKKTIMVVIFCTFSLTVFAQTSTQGFVEVKGVETSWNKYPGDNRKEYYGVTFTNKNSFPVIVEVELWESSSRISNTKSFVLQKDESYLWKLELEYYHASRGGYGGSGSFYYHIKFKAFKF